MAVASAQLMEVHMHGHDSHESTRQSNIYAHPHARAQSCVKPNAGQ